MANERELKTAQADRLYDLLEVFKTPETERDAVLKRQITRAKGGMTVEEIGHVYNLIAEAEVKADEK